MHTTAITYGTVALRCPVELSNELHSEPLLELPPDLRLHSVAKHEPHCVLRLLGSHRLGQQVATYLSNILGNLRSHKSTQIIHLW